MQMAVKIAPEQIVRKLLQGGIIITVPNPRDTNKMTNSDGEIYEQFGVPVQGGYLNFHLYDRKYCTLHGKRLLVEARVWHKVYPDGREFMYVDLYPTQASCITHERKIYQNRHELPDALPLGSLKFDTYDKIRASLVFIPYQTKA